MEVTMNSCLSACFQNCSSIGKDMQQIYSDTHAVTVHRPYEMSSSNPLLIFTSKLSNEG